MDNNGNYETNGEKNMAWMIPIVAASQDGESQSRNMKHILLISFLLAIMAFFPLVIFMMAIEVNANTIWIISIVLFLLLMSLIAIVAIGYAEEPSAKEKEVSYDLRHHKKIDSRLNDYSWDDQPFSSKNYCTQCGGQIYPSDRYCETCGRRLF